MPPVTDDVTSSGLTGAEQSEEWVVFPETKDEDFAAFVPLGCAAAGAGAHAHSHGHSHANDHSHGHGKAGKKHGRNKDLSDVLPHATLSEILKSIPAEASAPSAKLAVCELLFTVACTAVAVYSVFRLPWALLPLGWALAGFALSHLYIIGHDCAHGTFVGSHRINRLIGELCFLPFMRSFQSFVREHVSGCKDSFPFFAHDNKSAANATANASGSGVDTKTPADASASVYSSHEHVSSTGGAGSGIDSFGVFGGVRTTDLLYGAVMGVVPLTLYAYGLETGGWLLARYWFCPLVAYKLVFPLVMSWWRGSCDVPLPPNVVSAIPSYRMRSVARVVKRTIRRLQSVPEHQTALQAAAASSASDLSHSDASSSSETDEDEKAESAAVVAEEQRLARLEPPKWSARWWMALLTRINYVNCTILLGTPAVAVYGMCTTDLQRPTAIWAFLYYVWTGLGITAGYHRLWAHRAYRASLFVRWFLLIGGTGALEGSIKWWCGGHRVHHRYTDTRYDPYNAKRGLLYSHIGWMMVHPRKDAFRRADISDLNADPLIRWQHTLYALVGPFCAFALPALVAHYGWGDLWGGLFYAGALRLFFVHHNTFCVNSIAHALGDQGYDDQRTPRDSIVTALLTFGEGYHNFHHEFPNDYRNGIRAWDYDPTKWLIRFFYAFGLTSELKQFPHNEIHKGQLVMQHKKLEQQKAAVRWPAAVEKLPVMDWAAIREACKPTGANGTPARALVVVNNLVHDVTNFVSVHPGGAALLRAAIGADATSRFTGRTGVYAHSRAAIHLLSNFRVARLPAHECVAHPPPLKPSEVAAVLAAKAATVSGAAAAASASASASASTATAASVPVLTEAAKPKSA